MAAAVGIGTKLLGRISTTTTRRKGPLASMILKRTLIIPTNRNNAAGSWDKGGCDLKCGEDKCKRNNPCYRPCPRPRKKTECMKKPCPKPKLACNDDLPCFHCPFTPPPCPKTKKGCPKPCCPVENPNEYKDICCGELKDADPCRIRDPCCPEKCEAKFKQCCPCNPCPVKRECCPPDEYQKGTCCNVPPKKKFKRCEQIESCDDPCCPRKPCCPDKCAPKDPCKKDTCDSLCPRPMGPDPCKQTGNLCDLTECEFKFAIEDCCQPVGSTRCCDRKIEKRRKKREIKQYCCLDLDPDWPPKRPECDCDYPRKDPCTPCQKKCNKKPAFWDGLCN